MGKRINSIQFIGRRNTLLCICTPASCACSLRSLKNIIMCSYPSFLSASSASALCGISQKVVLPHPDPVFYNAVLQSLGRGTTVLAVQQARVPQPGQPPEPFARDKKAKHPGDQISCELTHDRSFRMLPALAKYPRNVQTSTIHIKLAPNTKH